MKYSLFKPKFDKLSLDLSLTYLNVLTHSDFQLRQSLYHPKFGYDFAKKYELCLPLNRRVHIQGSFYADSYLIVCWYSTTGKICSLLFPFLDKYIDVSIDDWYVVAKAFIDDHFS